MVLGPRGAMHEDKLEELRMTLLVARWHQAELQQVYWFKMAAPRAGRTTQAAGPMNLMKPRVRLEVGANSLQEKVYE
jgi:hypothetical protein